MLLRLRVMALLLLQETHLPLLKQALLVPIPPLPPPPLLLTRAAMALLPSRPLSVARGTHLATLRGLLQPVAHQAPAMDRWFTRLPLRPQSLTALGASQSLDELPPLLKQPPHVYPLFHQAALQFQT